MDAVDELAWIRGLCRSGTARTIRQNAQISLAEVGAAVDPPVAATTVHRWETGARLPRGDHAHQYAAILRRLRRAAARVS